VSPLPGDQARQLAPAGHQHQAARAGRQQGPDLVGITGVVGDDQHPPVRQDTSVQRLLGADAGRDLLGRHLEGDEDITYHLRCSDRCPPRAEAPQVHIQLAVREPAAHPVSPVQGQRGLAHTRGPADSADDQRTAFRPLGANHGLQQAVQLMELGSPSDEGRDGRRQLPWLGLPGCPCTRSWLWCLAGIRRGGSGRGHQPLRGLGI
jgi:hypothetical protein